MVPDGIEICLEADREHYTLGPSRATHNLVKSQILPQPIGSIGYLSNPTRLYATQTSPLIVKSVHRLLAIGFSDARHKRTLLKTHFFACFLKPFRVLGQNS